MDIDIVQFSSRVKPASYWFRAVLDGALAGCFTTDRIDVDAMQQDCAVNVVFAQIRKDIQVIIKNYNNLVCPDPLPPDVKGNGKVWINERYSSWISYAAERGIRYASIDNKNGNVVVHEDGQDLNLSLGAYADYPRSHWLSSYENFKNQCPDRKAKIWKQVTDKSLNKGKKVYRNSPRCWPLDTRFMNPPQDPEDYAGHTFTNGKDISDNYYGFGDNNNNNNNNNNEDRYYNNNNNNDNEDTKRYSSGEAHNKARPLNGHVWPTSEDNYNEFKPPRYINNNGNDITDKKQVKKKVKKKVKVTGKYFKKMNRMVKAQGGIGDMEVFVKFSKDCEDTGEAFTPENLNRFIHRYVTTTRKAPEDNAQDEFKDNEIAAADNAQDNSQDYENGVFIEDEDDGALQFVPTRFIPEGDAEDETHQ